MSKEELLKRLADVVGDCDIEMTMLPGVQAANDFTTSWKSCYADGSTTIKLKLTPKPKSRAQLAYDRIIAKGYESHDVVASIEEELTRAVEEREKAIASKLDRMYVFPRKEGLLLSRADVLRAVTTK